MKKVLIIIFVVLLAISAIGCDAGLEIVEMDVERYPDRIAYYSGIDNELDLKGGAVVYFSKDGTKSIEEMTSQFLTISHNVDFNTPGVYVVEIISGKVKCRFPIEVIRLQ